MSDQEIEVKHFTTVVIISTDIEDDIKQAAGIIKQFVFGPQEERWETR